MTVRAPIIDLNTDSAETFRLALGGLWVQASALNPRTGVTTTPVLTGTGNLTATVGPFTAMIDGTSNSLQGGYPVALDAASTVTIGAGNTQARIDLISLQMLDGDYDGSGLRQGQLVVTAGTPSGSPVAPATPANAIPLWTIPVAALATSVTWGSATAVYSYTAAAGGIVPARNASDKPAAPGAVQYRHRLDVTGAAGATTPLEYSVDNGVTWRPVWDAAGLGTAFVCTSSTRPSSPAAGRQIYETDTKQVAVYNGTTWIYLYDNGGTWTAPTISVANTGANIQYRVNKDRVDLRGSFNNTNALTIPVQILSGLPAPSTTRTGLISAANSYTVALMQVNTSGNASIFFTPANIPAGNTLWFDGFSYFL